MSRVGLVALFALTVACSNKKKEDAPPPPIATASAVPGMPDAPVPTAASAAPQLTAPAGSPPADGKYERVVVEGVTVPMIQVMDQGATVLVDTDGKKPRTWEEQYKRKRATLSAGQYDLHKTNANKNDTFNDDPIDKEGLWVIDEKGTITKR